MNEHLKYVNEQLRLVDEFCEENIDMDYDNLYDKIEEMLKEIRKYAVLYRIPLNVYAEDIIAKFRDEEDYYEESSSYYEEESYESSDYDY